MLARLHVLLPYHYTVPESVPFGGYGVELIDGCTVRFLPPGRSDRPLPHDAPDFLEIDGKPAFLADVFVVEFRKDSFDRRITAEVDPSIEVMQEVVDWFFRRLRYVINAPDMEPIVFPAVPYRLTYLADDGTDLPEEKGLTRGRGILKFEYKCKALTPQIWDDLFRLPPAFEPPQWEVLLLDARASMPDVGTAIVLAATALEVFISTILNQLAERGKISPTLWEWINDRKFFLKEPSTEEQFDVLLKELAGVTLKSDKDLWQAFQTIRQGRNNFVHGGKPEIGDKAKRLITRAEALSLITKTGAIIEFVKASLPEELRWPKFSYQFNLRIRHRIPRESEPDDTPKADQAGKPPPPPPPMHAPAKPPFLARHAYSVGVPMLLAAFLLGLAAGKAFF